MEFRQLKTFVTAAQMESFSRAAQELGYSQSAVTVQIRLLEEELGVKLFDRLGKRFFEAEFADFKGSEPGEGDGLPGGGDGQPPAHRHAGIALLG